MKWWIKWGGSTPGKSDPYTILFTTDRTWPALGVNRYYTATIIQRIQDVYCSHSLRLFHLPSQRSRCGQHKRCLVLWFHSSFLLLRCLYLSLTNVNGDLLSSSSHTSAVCQKPGKTKPPSRLTTLPPSVRSYNRLALRIFQTMLLPLEWPLREIDYNAH